RYCGDWSGLAPEGMGAHKKPALLAGMETAIVVTHNLTPPVFPFTKAWHDTVERLMPRTLVEQLDKITELGSVVAMFDVGELQTEENGGLGFGVCVLLIASVAAAAVQKRRWQTTRATSI